MPETFAKKRSTGSTPRRRAGPSAARPKARPDPDFDLMKGHFGWGRAVLAVTLESATQTL